MTVLIVFVFSLSCSTECWQRDSFAPKFHLLALLKVQLACRGSSMTLLPSPLHTEGFISSALPFKIITKPTVACRSSGCSVLTAGWSIWYYTLYQDQCVCVCVCVCVCTPHSIRSSSSGNPSVYSYSLCCANLWPLRTSDQQSLAWRHQGYDLSKTT